MSSQEDQLLSFFAYSFIIYPITGYLVSPARSYPRWRGALYAILFLLSVALIHMYYDYIEKGPNYYQLLNVTRGSTISTLKKAYRHLSLELHPDKNKSPTAEEDFRKVKLAFDSISNLDLRRGYNLLGEAGAKIASKGVLDMKYIVIQMIVYYGSSLIFAFLMTFSEPSGDALNSSLFGLAVLLFIESVLLLEELEIPASFLPYYTSNDVVQFLHRLYPAYINCARCITGAFYVDRRQATSKALKDIWELVEKNTEKVKDIAMKIRSSSALHNPNSSTVDELHKLNCKGIMSLSLNEAEKCNIGAIISMTENESLMKQVAAQRSAKKFLILRNLGIYILAFYVYAQYKNRKVSVDR